MPSTPTAALDKLQALRNHGSRFGVDRMRRLAELIGHPERKLPCIHVAGTNGKGSTSAMIEAIQRAHGRTTGLYTSPHLVRLGERVQINRRVMPERALLAYCEELFPLVELMEAEDADLRPSFFELMTAVAFLAFAREPVDVAVVEVGLGGRLDATNILEAPLVTVITSIGLDHTDMLGTTIAAIAAEKAGILKPGVPLALGLVPAEAEAVIRARAAAVGVVVHAVAERFQFSAFGVREAPPETNLAGDHQRANAALAYLACELAGRRGAGLTCNPATALRALSRVDWAGRWQVFGLSKNRTLILDVAHNEEGARALDNNLAALGASVGPPLAGAPRRMPIGVGTPASGGPTGTPSSSGTPASGGPTGTPSSSGTPASGGPTGARPHVVVGVLGVDRARPLLAVIARHAGAITLVRPDQERACSLDELAACVPADFAGPVRRSTVAAIFPDPGVCALGEAGETVVVTGSVYLAGEVLSRYAEDVVCDEYTRYQDRLPPA